MVFLDKVLSGTYCNWKIKGKISESLFIRQTIPSFNALTVEGFSETVPFMRLSNHVFQSQ